MQISSGKMIGLDNVFIVTLSGKIYSDNSEALEKELVKIIDQNALYIVLNCTGLVQIDSSGLSAIITAVRKIKSEKQGEIFTFGQKESLKTIFSLTKLDHFVQNFETEDDAARHIKVKILKG